MWVHSVLLHIACAVLKTIPRWSERHGMAGSDGLLSMCILLSSCLVQSFLDFLSFNLFPDNSTPHPVLMLLFPSLLSNWHTMWSYWCSIVVCQCNQQLNKCPLFSWSGRLKEDAVCEPDNESNKLSLKLLTVLLTLSDWLPHRIFHCFFFMQKCWLYIDSRFLLCGCQYCLESNSYVVRSISQLKIWISLIV